MEYNYEATINLRNIISVKRIVKTASSSLFTKYFVICLVCYWWLCRIKYGHSYFHIRCNYLEVGVPSFLSMFFTRNYWSLRPSDLLSSESLCLTVSSSVCLCQDGSCSIRLGHVHFIVSPVQSRLGCIQTVHYQNSFYSTPRDRSQVMEPRRETRKRAQEYRQHQLRVHHLKFHLFEDTRVCLTYGGSVCRNTEFSSLVT